MLVTILDPWQSIPYKFSIEKSLAMNLHYIYYQKYVPSGCKYLSFNVIFYYIVLYQIKKLIKLNKNIYKKIIFILILF